MKSDQKLLISISKEKAKLDLNLICHFLQNSYWAKDRSTEKIEKSIQNSICFGVYEGEQQIGFARVISDQATFAYLADVFIVKSHRGLGYSKKLMSTILSDPLLNEVSKWYLVTKDAQGLYQQFDFADFDNSEKSVMCMKA